MREPESIPFRLAGCRGEIGDEGVSREGCVYKHDLSCADLKTCRVVTSKSGVASDENSLELMKLAAEEIEKKTNGLRPYLIISHLHRSRLDPNREDLEGAQGDPLAIQAYREFHSAINHAKSVVKRGLLVDFHGFNLDWETRNRTEIGYLISKDPLNQREFDVKETSFRALVTRRKLDKNLILGNESVGAFFEESGYPAVPSPSRSPGSVRYYRGGFITRYHGSRYDENDEIDAVQLEFPRQLRMGGSDVVNKLGKTTGGIIVKFYNAWYE